ncbi:MAG: metal-dependent hydrolase [Wenzhouxiangella sp.]|nr:MAG: metal-dependent hydrolase [Wenzhouxiangella sp.]
MDPVTHAVFGGLWALPAARRQRMRQAAVAGALSGVAADADIFIRSSEDSLLYIEFHRQFTHALVFVPIGSLVVALLLWPVFRRWASFGRLYLWCFLGYLAHPLLDAATSYGTHLFWPFADTRVALNWVSVIDPLYSLPLLLLLVAAAWRRSVNLAALGLFWMVLYMGLAAVQNLRAEQALVAWAEQENVSIERAVAKPAFANIILWRALVDDGQRFHLVAIRNLPGSPVRIWPGGSVEPFSAHSFDPDTRLGSDLQRFEHFSSHWLFRFPDYDEDGEWFVGDIRYAIDPASLRPLWGVRFDPEDPDSHARYTTPRRVTESERELFLDRLLDRLAD